MSKDKPDKVTHISEHLSPYTETPGDSPPPIKCKECKQETEYFFAHGKWREPLTDGLCDECIEKSELKKNEELEIRKNEGRRKYREENIDKLLGEAGVPTAYKSKTFDDYKNIDDARKVMLTTASKFTAALIADQFQNNYGLFLGGARGVGKTHLGVAIMREAILAGIKSRFENFPRALLRIKGTFGKTEGPDERELIQRTASIPFLVLDDLGKETLGSWAKTTAYLIINEREFEGLPFVITSNLYLKEIADLYDDAIASRINGACRVIEIDRKTPDFRGRS